MKIIKLLLICLCFTPCNALPKENTQFYPPTLSPEEALQFAERHLEEEKINLDKYKLRHFNYTYGPRKWNAGYTLYSDNNEPTNNTLNIYINDEYPSDYYITKY